MGSTTTRESVHIPGAQGRAFGLKAGEAFRVVDVDGSQVADLVALSRENLEESSSTAQTILFNHPRYRLREGDHFYSSLGRPMFQVVSDDARGVHDLWYAACNPRWYEAIGQAQQANCQENLLESLRGRLPHMTRRDVPHPINLFQSIDLRDDGTLDIGRPATGPDSGITLRAHLDCVVAVTSCAYGLSDGGTSINGTGPTPIRIDFPGPVRGVVEDG